MCYNKSSAVVCHSTKSNKSGPITHWLHGSLTRLQAILLMRHPHCYIALTHANGEHFPVPPEVDTRIRFDAVDQSTCHKHQVSRDAPDLGDIELRGQVEGIRVADRVAKQFRVELLQDIRQGRGVAKRPLAANAPAQATVVDEQVHERCGGCSSGGS